MMAELLPADVLADRLARIHCVLSETLDSETASRQYALEKIDAIVNEGRS